MPVVSNQPVFLTHEMTGFQLDDCPLPSEFACFAPGHAKASRPEWNAIPPERLDCFHGNINAIIDGIVHADVQVHIGGQRADFGFDAPDSAGLRAGDSVILWLHYLPPNRPTSLILPQLESTRSIGQIIRQRVAVHTVRLTEAEHQDLLEFLG